jgi:hypothetical protein
MEKRLIGGVLLLIGAISGLAWGGMLIAGADFAEDADPTGIIEGALTVCGAVFLVFSIIALVGAIMAITGKSWGLGIVGGIFGLLCFGISGTGSLFSLIGLIIIAISKDEFGDGPPPGTYAPPPAYPSAPPPGAPPYPGAEQPPAQPPMEQPPAQPPMEQPPAQPPMEQPPAEPPMEQPPAEKPPEEPQY